MEDFNIKINDKTLKFSERVEQYVYNAYGIYKTGKDKNNLRIMLENMEDYDVDMDIGEQFSRVSKVFELPNFDEDAIRHLLREEFIKILEPIYTKEAVTA